MVKEINEKSALWKSLVLTVILFLIGVSLGVFIEFSRTKTIKDRYEQLELDLLDSRLRQSFYQIMGRDFCEIAIKDNLEFSDRIYQEGKKIDVYEKFNRLSDQLDDQKRRYGLLKTEFWMNSLVLKEKCEADYNVIVYFYRDNPESDEEKQLQNVQSRILGELKEKYGNSIMLIPLPIDLGLSIVNSFVELHDIRDMPTLLINEEIKLEGLHSLESIEKLI